MTTEPEPAGRIIITWPAPTNGATLGWGIAVRDADTGKPIVDATALTIAHGSPSNWDTGPIYATLTRLVGTDGTPITAGSESGNNAIPTAEFAAWRDAHPEGNFEGQQFRTADFRYLVAEMRATPADPTIPTRESVNRGEHTIDQYREHHGITAAAPLPDDATH